MQCPHCQQNHPDNIRVCPTTNKPLARWIVCPHCGRESRPGSRFCAGCGKALPKSSAKGDLAPSEAGPEEAALTPPAAPVVVPPVKPEPLPPGVDKPDKSQRLAPLAVEPKPAKPKSELSGFSEDGSFKEAVRKPAPSAPPVTLDGTAEAWTAIPTSPHDRILAEAPAERRPSTMLIIFGLIGLAVLAALAYGFLASGAPAASATATPNLTPSQDGSQMTQAAALVNTQTAAAVPSATTPPTATSRPATATRPAATATVAAAAVITPTQAASGPEAYRLAFIGYTNGVPAVTLMNPDRPADEWLSVPLPTDYETAVWPSFCGDKIAFESEDRSFALPRWVFLYDLLSQALTPAVFADPQPDRVYSPACAPGGNWMTVTTRRAGDWSMDVIAVDSGELIHDQPNGIYPQLGYASWSSDGSSFVWMGVKQSGFFDINQTTNVSTDGHPRTTLMLQGKYPAISPDGSLLAYFCGNLSHLCMAEWPSKELLFQIPISYFKQINERAAPASAVWSADGAWLYFASSVSGNWDIYRMRPDGSQIQNLTERSTADELMPTAR